MSNALTTNTTTASGFGLLLSPATLKEANEFAAMLAKSDLVPKAFANKPGDILIAGAMGARLGLDIFSALSGIAVVNGKPTLYGDAMLAVCQVRPDFEDIAETVKGQGDNLEASCTVKRKGRSPYTATFSAADAKRASLWGKQGPWSAMPQRMCQMRARAFALRGAFADALAGFHAREEIDDAIDVTSTATVRVPEPTAGVVREVQATIDPQPVTDPQDQAPPSDKPQTTEISVEQLHAAVTKLWKLKPGGTDAAKALLVTWKLDAVSDMGGADDETRAKFLDAVEEKTKALIAGGAK